MARHVPREDDTSLPQSSSKRSPETDTKAIVHSVLTDGTEPVVSYGDTGQNSGDGMGLQFADLRR